MKPLSKYAGWMAPDGTVETCHLYNHFECLLEMAKNAKQPETNALATLWSDLEREQAAEREALEEERAADPTDDGYGWHSYYFHADNEKKAKREEIIDKAYNMGFIRMGIQGDQLNCEGVLSKLQRRGKELKDVAIDTGIEKGKTYTLQLVPMKVDTRSITDRLLDHLKDTGAPAQGDKLLTVVKFVKDKDALKKVLRLFPNLNVDAVKGWIEQYGTFARSLDQTPSNLLTKIATWPEETRLAFLRKTLEKDQGLEKPLKTIRDSQKLEQALKGYCQPTLDR